LAAHRTCFYIGKGDRHRSQRCVSIRTRVVSLNRRSEGVVHRTGPGLSAYGIERASRAGYGEAATTCGKRRFVQPSERRKATCCYAARGYAAVVADVTGGC